MFGTLLYCLELQSQMLTLTRHSDWNFQKCSATLLLPEMVPPLIRKVTPVSTLTLQAFHQISATCVLRFASSLPTAQAAESQGQGAAEHYVSL